LSFECTTPLGASASFLSRYCAGVEKVLPYLTGETDGVAKDADWAAAITGVPAATIRDLARRMAATRTMLSAASSLQRTDHGDQPYWAVFYWPRRHPEQH
jgi:biotin/methionine sulfoxide reductase